MFKVGDRVRIKNDTNYTGIIMVLGDPGCWNVIRMDKINVSYVYYDYELELIQHEPMKIIPLPLPG